MPGGNSRAAGPDARPAAPLVYAVVLGFEKPADVLECLASLERSSYGNIRTLLLAYHLPEDALHAIRAAYPAVRIVELRENKGYAGNNNIGVRVALHEGADWVFLLNDDTIVDRECVARLIDGVEQDPAIGVVGPMVYHHAQPSTIQSAGGTLSRLWHSTHVGQNEVDRGQYRHVRAVDWVSGCAMMVSRAAVETAGCLDERYFMYWEEVDWCLRVRQTGRAVLHVPDAKVWHKGVQAHYSPSPAVTYYSTRNLLLMLRLHHAPAVARLVRWGQVFRTLAAWTLRPKWRHDKAPHRQAMWRATVDHLQGRWGPMP